ncbi:L-2-hydroxyglutarate oxidase [Tunicatimonas pelagia]|uniref:L-2-hydroxyglutarate oxidase n=1 Tax=Tunicatimonas pelagia TaxID=931531 RepID=UPI002665F16F|nr:L-2-hydroxyglutarate oxidase [Tunicatimonas pelagia]WKN40529.1 L-2-hydroxyglutarate oxidase [Tunicatimonas pelagia]
MEYDIVIIGGGIVGLATALKLKEKRPQLKLAVLDKETKVAAHQTGHNSGVIHSGVYYKPGSLKATNCIRGYQMLLDFCQQHEVPHECCGKVIVATRPSELPQLDKIQERGAANGLTGLKRLAKEEIAEYEPHINGLEAIFVPQTGIIDYTAVCQKYAELMQKQDGLLFLDRKVLDIRTHISGSTIITNHGTFTARVIVNCAGLYSDKVAQMMRPDVNVKIVPFRGEYYELKEEKQYLVKNLIYPVPDPAFPFLGVHFTRMIGGGIEAGPNAVLAFRREGYTKSDVHVGELSETITWPGFQKVARKYWRTGLGEMYRSFSKSAFTKALQHLIPDVQEDDLVPGGAGVRAQACDRNGGLLDDFKIMEDEYAVHVLNAPSPAATSSLSIGQTVSELVLPRFNQKRAAFSA